MSNFVGTVEDRIQNASLTTFDSIVVPKTDLAMRSKNASSTRDSTIVTAISECWEHIGITAPFETVSERNNTFYMLTTNDESRNNIPDETSELSVPGTHFDGQPNTRNMLYSKVLLEKCKEIMYKRSRAIRKLRWHIFWRKMRNRLRSRLVSFFIWPILKTICTCKQQ